MNKLNPVQWMWIVVGAVFMSLFLALCITRDENSGKSIESHDLAPASTLFAMNFSVPSAVRYPNQLRKSINYLVSHFDPKVALVSESEDEGTHWLKRTEFPHFHWKYNQTFWLYSDNLYAMHALEPWRPDISRQINAAFIQYNQPISGKFEAVTGVVIGPDRAAVDYIINQSDHAAVLIRRHNGSEIGESNAADTLMYQALSSHSRGMPEEARQHLEKVVAMWNGSCIVDEVVLMTAVGPGGAPSDVNWCMNYKVGLLLFTAQVIPGIMRPEQLHALEDHLWKNMQNPDGGISSLATRWGTRQGSANCESTSLAVLAYNSNLIRKLNGIPFLSEAVESSPPLAEQLQ